jgi:hypothetical protein
VASANGAFTGASAVRFGIANRLYPVSGLRQAES